MDVVTQAAHRAVRDEAVWQAESAYFETAQHVVIGKQFQNGRGETAHEAVLFHEKKRVVLGGKCEDLFFRQRLYPAGIEDRGQSACFFRSGESCFCAGQDTLTGGYDADAAVPLKDELASPEFVGGGAFGEFQSRRARIESGVDAAA